MNINQGISAGRTALGGSRGSNTRRRIGRVVLIEAGERSPNVECGRTVCVGPKADAFERQQGAAFRNMRAVPLAGGLQDRATAACVPRYACHPAGRAPAGPGDCGMRSEICVGPSGHTIPYIYAVSR